MKNYLFYLFLLFTAGLCAQSSVLTQFVMGQQRFNSVYLPYNKVGQMVLDSILIEGGAGIESVMIPNFSGDKITSYKITSSIGTYDHADMNINFNPDGKPASYKVLLSNASNKDTAEGNFLYTSTGKQNYEFVKFSFSNPAKIPITKSYHQPWWVHDENNIDTMQVDIMGEVHNHNRTAFRFGKEAKLISFKSSGTDSAEYHYDNYGLIWHIHYANGDEVEYFWSQITSVRDEKVNHLKIYPNPSNGEVYITSATKGEYEVYDVNGNKLITHSLSGSGVLNLSALEDGIYFVKKSDTFQYEKLMLIK